MLLSEIVKAITKEKKATSWLDPHGNFWFVEKQHGLTAREMIPDVTDPMVILWQRGWMRVTYYTHDALYAHNELGKMPNHVQQRELIGVAQDNNFPKLVWDGGTDSKVLWSEYDNLE